MNACSAKTMRALIPVALLSASIGAWAEGPSDLKAVLAQEEGLRVSIDPKTKAFRPLSAEDAKALEKAAPAAAKTKPVAVQSRFPMAKGIRLGAEQMSFATASVGADGKLTLDCMEGDEAAHKAILNGSSLHTVKTVEAERE
jgi:hypothetical protein